MEIIRGIIGITVLIALTFLFSEKKRAVSWRVVGIGLALQIFIAIVLLKIPIFQSILKSLNHLVQAIQSATLAGSQFLFGYLAGGEFPFEVTNPNSTFILSFQSLPLVLVVSALSSLLYYWRILPLIVKVFAAILQRTIGISSILLSTTIFRAYVYWSAAYF